MKKNINILYQSIGKNIKKLRKGKKIGQNELAKLISLSRSSLSNIEIGKHQPSIYTIFEIAIALDCKVNDLLPSIEDYKTLNYTIDEKFRVILDSLSNDISIKNINILKDTLKTNRDES